MNDLKNKVASIFEEIQYESEDLIAGLIEEAADSPVEEQLKSLRVTSSQHISKELKKASADLTSFASTDEIEVYLDYLKQRFKDFFAEVKHQEALVLEGQDIDEFVEHLKQESDDWVYKMTQKSKEVVQQAKEKLNLEDVNKKASETWHQLKEKSTDVIDEVKEKSSDVWHQVKEKFEVTEEDVEDFVEDLHEATEEVVEDVHQSLENGN